MKPKILVMDDDEAICRISTLLLNKLGYEVDTTPSGNAALECYEKAMKAGTPYRAVLLDLTVASGMGGLEVLPKLKALNPDVNAIVVSGATHETLPEYYKLHGFRGGISKPFRIQDLVNCLNSLGANPAV